MAHSLRQLFLAASRHQQVSSREIFTSAVVSVEKGLNKVQLMGRVGNVPKEFTNTNSGRKLVAFPLVTANHFKTKNPDGTETMTTKSTWHSINIFLPSLQNIAMKYVQKGARLYLNGKIHNTKYNKEDGTEKYISVVIAEDLIMLTRPQSQEENEFSDGAGTGSGQIESESADSGLQTEYGHEQDQPN